MARKSSPTISQDESYPPSEEFAREEIEDARLLDLDVEQESPFLRAQNRVSVRRSSLPKKAATRLKCAALALMIGSVMGVAAVTVYRYGEHPRRSRRESSNDSALLGLPHVTH